VFALRARNRQSSASFPFFTSSLDLFVSPSLSFSTLRPVTAASKQTNAEAAWMDALRARFIVFEGPDGSGKTTQFNRFVQRAKDAGLAVCDVREPGGTAIGERIRDLLLDNGCDEMSVRCEMLLYMASRAQLVAERILPAQANGELVVADRFVHSTVAYQGAAGGISREDIRKVADVVLAEVHPDLVLIFDVDEATAAKRITGARDRMESKDIAFRARVREGYHEQAKLDPDRCLLVPAGAEADEVERRTLQAVRSRLAAAR